MPTPKETDPAAPTLQMIREYLEYDPVSGNLYWIKSPSNRVARRFIGGRAVAGHRDRNATQLRFKGVLYMAHRLAWAIHHGEWPSGLIDHVNGDPCDNRLSNLRICTHQQNLYNTRRRKNNTSGFKGVSRMSGSSRWVAYLHHNGKKKSLGCYPTAELAAAAYDKAANEIFGEFASPNNK